MQMSVLSNNKASKQTVDASKRRQFIGWLIRIIHIYIVLPVDGDTGPQF